MYRGVIEKWGAIGQEPIDYRALSKKAHQFPLAQRLSGWWMAWDRAGFQVEVEFGNENGRRQIRQGLTES